ncbi:hypothetical protein MOQ72_17085 [Saccharopolyspora sp. K220]|uniref:WXG100 family type VII secretion target n=1 Tax=Saccharopolyspora soli TaxID=2926618 RepID=UPI001F567146|nr:hypothetical protein [Saccharopolyspora soli]MCI2419162.1 hypothetical protein [Saccharopolyspora soli]
MTSADSLQVTAAESAKESEAKGTANPMSGAGGAENLVGTAQAIQNGDWDSAGLNALGLGVDMVGLAADPLGTLASWGVGWLIENVEFIREPFDALMGNPDAISGMASTWENVGKEVKAVAQEYGQTAQATTGWEGKAGDAYRNLGADTSKMLDALGEGCNGVKGAVDGAGVVVGAVRGIVRDMIAGCIGEIIGAVLRWGIAAACTAGIAAGGLIADAIRIALKWADKISEWMNKLADVLKNLSSHLDKLGSAGKSIRTKVDGFFEGLANPPALHAVKVQPKTISGQQIDDIASNATTEGASKLSNAWSGFKAGGAEYKPFASGDLRPDMVVDMGPDGGASKFGYETVKETAKLDDGADAAENSQDGK